MPAAGPEEVVRGALEELRTPSAEAVAAALDEGEREALEAADVEPDELAAALLGHLSYRLTGSELGEETATIDLELTHLDLREVLRAAANAIIHTAPADRRTGDALGARLLLEQLRAPDAPTVSTPLTVEVVRREGVWELVDAPALARAALIGTAPTDSDGESAPASAQDGESVPDSSGESPGA